jgi:solute carrier family 25 oxoglutarate transporter 11
MGIIMCWIPSEARLSCPPNQITVAKDIIAKDGFGSLYKGLNAGLLRQATYTTARLGIFSIISEKVGGGG